MGWLEDARPLTWSKLTGSANTSIITGGQAQNLALGRGFVRGFQIVNPSTSTAESLWFEPNPDVNGAAVVGQCMEVPSGGNLFFGPGQTINNIAPSIIGTTGGHAFVVYVGR